MSTTATISIRMSMVDKKNFEAFCENVGMNVTTAFNMFVKAVLREQKLPFEVKGDPFYSSENMARLEKAIAQLDAGKGKEHELIEVDQG